MTPRRCLIAAGGTGGHMFPARAAAEALIERGWQIRLVTDARGRKHTEGFPAVSIDEIHAASPFTKNPIKLLKAGVELTQGVAQAREIVTSWKPDVVAGFGGYPAFPALAAARIAGIPYCIHEQNAVLGRVNRTFAAKAGFIASGFERLDLLPESAKRRHILTGNPLRDPIVDARAAGYPAVSESGRLSLLVLGGSLGARILSETVPTAIAALPEKLKSRLDIVQQTREENLAMARETYEKAGVNAVCEPFFDNVGELYAKAHLVIGRAGASTVSEVMGVGRPAIFCPLGIAMDDHQTANAEGMKTALAADVLRESDFTPEKLAALLEARLGNLQDLSERAAAARSLGRPDAADALAKAVDGLVTGAVQ
ncbi:MAG: undecaprenyldiphospho-muramoylpentapeptide beta-N-acetylglucosaminyltransferase [Alphaproteobacteria bacterium]|nr:undecaprenyldiphospho-muramoylpentapeptide beta-N-acetylglucosaminyltransferase [Alphaproteobacteria bacterium]